ncbi:MAG: PAS domain-containing protein [Candidatus Sumerlaeota bacterium]|nr:PAS domain-containing protein [Candidatus Sumerlaeota bacterium]
MLPFSQWRIKSKFMLMMAVFIMATAVVYTLLSYYFKKDVYLKATDAKLLTAAICARAMLPPDYHDKIENEGSVSREEFLNIVRKFDALCSKLGLSYIWSLMIYDDQIVFTTASSIEHNADKSDHAWFLEKHTSPDVYQEVFKKMDVQYSTFHDKWGEGRMALIPKYDRYGRKYLFAASVQMKEVESILRGTALEALTGSAIIFLLGMIVAHYMAQTLSGPIEEITACTERIAMGNMNEVIPVRESCHELTTLANSFNIMRDAIRRKIEELRKNEERFKLALKGADLGLWDWNMKTGDLTFNERWAEMLGYAPAEIKPHIQSWEGLLHPDDWLKAQEALKNHSEGRAPFYEAEYRCRTKSGEWKWILARGRIFERGAQGAPLRMTGTHLDISDRKQAEQERRLFELQVQQAQKLESLGVLAGGIAHDFNNLLTAILGNLDLALSDLSPMSPARDNLIAVEKASIRASELCKQMLAYSGRGKFVIQQINLNELIQEMAHMLEVSTSKKAILRCNFAPTLPAIEADATQLRQVIMNLIVNASEAISDRSGYITVTTGAMECDENYLREISMTENLRPGRYVYIEVTDTGCGMDAETKSKIFDPFFTTKFTGRGLGLAAVLGIVRGHKGYIKVYSEPGRGTTFKALFPASDKSAAPLAQAAETAFWRGSGTVLIVDDEEVVRDLAKSIMKRFGFSVLLAAHGSEALKIFREHSAEIVCVLLDLTMPHMDGEETFRELRRIRGDVRVILSSGYSEQEVTQRFVGKGLAGFIQKPYQAATLSAKMREALAGA